MKTKKDNFNTLMLLIYFITLMSGLVYAQTTTVTPVLTLTASGIVDQDDMCIWIHPTDKSQSTIITSDKTASKLFVYDLSGNTLQTINVPGKPGNIDIRYNFELSGQPTDIVGYNDRDNGTIVFYKVDPITRQLSFVGNFGDGGMTGNNYGFCLYHSPTTGKYYAIASSNSTQMKQWEIVDNGAGSIGGVFKRTWNNGLGDITEGLVADDETAQLYCGNEGEGVYKYRAEPTDPTTPLNKVIVEGQNGLSQDLEGITIYYAANGEGYIILSSQGNSTFKVYNRKEPHTFVKTIDVVNASSTDGIEVTNVNLGTAFPSGMFLNHDGTGSGPYPIRVSKYEDLGLTVDTSYWNPRGGGNTNPLLNLIIPNGGEVWNAGELHEITWSSQNINNIKIEVSTDNGSIWIPIINTIPASNGTYSDTIPEFSSTQCRVKISDLSDLSIFDISDNTFTITSTSDLTEESNITPNDYKLFQNYPNPFNPSTKISWQSPVESWQTLKVYDLLGNEVASLVDEYKPAGKYEADFTPEGLSSGVYIYILNATTSLGIFNIQTRKMILLK